MISEYIYNQDNSTKKKNDCLIKISSIDYTNFGKIRREVGIVPTKLIALPKLDKLEPNLESTALKLMEETGELAQCIGKFRCLNGEKVQRDQKENIQAIACELLDVAQTAVTMMYVLEEQFNVDIENALEKHINKLIQKGYLTDI